MSSALVITPCRHDVPTTAALLTAALRQQAITLFATVDHVANARNAGLDLPDAIVVVFGDPRAGTPVMRADPRAGIDLPLRILVWSQGGETQLGFRDPNTMADDFSIGGQTAVLARQRDALDGLVTEVTR